MSGQRDEDSWHEGHERPEPVEVPIGQLSPEALRGVVESFVLREGTDYGDRAVTHEAKVSQVLRQLERGEARIVYDPLTESVDIVRPQPFRRDGDR
jgi:uncharacterized protein YheU (UPF0270 family)